jgi:hypothetical protein
METTTTTTRHRSVRVIIATFVAVIAGHHGTFGDHAEAASSPSYVVDYDGSSDVWTIDGIPFGSSVTEDSPIVPLFVGVTS